LKAKYSSFEGKEVTGVVFLLVFQRLDYLYFFLFRCNLHISAFQSDAFFTNVAQSNLFFKESEDFDEDEQVYKITKQPFFYYFPFDNEKQESCYYIFTTLFTHIMQSEQSFISALFWSNISNILPIYTHTSLSFFALTSISPFKFEIINRCYLQQQILVWSKQALNILRIDTKNLDYFDYKTDLQVKPFLFFSEYCRSSKRLLVEGQKKIVLKEKAILIFNFNLWFDLAIRFGWFSVGGFLKFNSFDYVTEIYNFMQYNLLDANVHCSFSHFDNKNNCLYFWLLFDRKSDFVEFRRKKTNLNFILTECFSAQNYLLIDNFLKSHMAFYPVNEQLSGCNICDFRTASYYVGIYSKNLYVLASLYENIMDLQSDFFPTDTLLYTMSVLFLDVMSMSDEDSSSPIEALRKQTGFRIMEDIWLFTRPYVSHRDLIFFFIDGQY
jgi:hypothetical protein